MGRKGLWFDSTEKQQKDEPGLICPKIPIGFSLPCVPLSKAPYSPNICSLGAVHGCSLLCVSCTRWVKSREKHSHGSSLSTKKPRNWIHPPRTCRSFMEPSFRQLLATGAGRA
ncbi:unnamed protein product [Pleuronectes platessa]|uniref:Uncharacterized protein n=1 Tax=Pleuronectes platessa TaxID=8262 RepID=A0A9N7W4M5_PLEPL|nr:unnamed protein product [Pleuronectes platessa]